ncbi:MAG: DUF547 domain-containing protein [Candidatus Aminicenantes bacterium]|nr:DUF547 domain-containing protein [Candidatus Aminicenantes bacterium]NIM84733.1 DUF547 domain-containing protein [Candidatus Aminicenantes bacterium]NIN23288.1 DUF547 domain-containing protein [Candidatus Aminicenantes bacterium]NIN46992.1 DUF547 domain-containing protein [Candidatus Aminicenantes bacterium]NIN89914.1 DUF547 domain-containing protein [Candidatus Aminicenantes bacterium]
MKKILILSTAVLVLVWFSFSAEAADKIDDLHATWDKLLKKHVKNGLVNYKGFANDVKQLDRYLETLEKTGISTYNREQELAFWINAYNAYTVKLILDHYPIKSIRKIDNPWGKRTWKAAGQTLSLDYIEHKILRKKFEEPRIHFAVVCASIGCPDLQSFAFQPEKLNDQLALAARQFFASPKHFYIKEDKNTIIIHINKIFSWFGNDFGKTKKERAAFMLPYLDKSTAEKLKQAKSLAFKYLPYDWNLNEKK